MRPIYKITKDRIYGIFRNYCPKKYKEKIASLISKKIPIIKDPKKVYPSVYRIKGDTWETVVIPEIFHLLKAWECVNFHAAQDILKIDNAIVTSVADYVITERGCLWDKYYQDNFSKIIPLDKGWVYHNQDFIYVGSAKKTINIESPCISLLGVHSAVWSHFIVQFLSKLYYADEANLLSIDNMCIIMPFYKDVQIRELINDVLSSYPNITIIQCDVNDRISYKCSTLYYIPTACALGNHANYESPFDSVIPQRVLDILKNKVVAPRIDKIDKNIKYPNKIYLVRRSNRRGLVNYEEVEEFFKSKGFYFLEPHKLTLLEKAYYFYNAEYIAGPCSAAWTNVIFCKSAKGLFLNILARGTDAYSKYLMQMGNVNVLQVTGWDLSSTVQADYYIPIDKLEKAYRQHFSN